MAMQLPMDIIETLILPRLPAKSLLRFKCVSKSLNTLISSPEFVDRHLHLCKTENVVANRIFIMNYRGSLCISNLDNYPEFPAMVLPYPQSRMQKFCGNVDIVGHCNGLLCAVGFSLSDGYEFMVFNPSTGIFIDIPFGHCTYEDFCSVNFGFGYDSLSGDYKIVSIIDYDLQEGLLREIHVYRQSAKSWRLVEKTSSVFDRLSHREYGILIDDHLLHWDLHCLGDTVNEMRIGCYDLCKEQWVENVPLPDLQELFDSYSTSNLNDRPLYSWNLDGCLCLVNQRATVVDVWIMKEYGAKESWVKVFALSDTCFTSIGLMLGVSHLSVDSMRMIPLAYRRGLSSEILLQIFDSSSLIWFSINDRKCRLAEIHELQGFPQNYESCVVKGSLVTIPGGYLYPIPKETQPRQETK